MLFYVTSVDVIDYINIITKTRRAPYRRAKQKL